MRRVLKIMTASYGAIDVGSITCIGISVPNFTVGTFDDTPDFTLADLPNIPVIAPASASVGISTPDIPVIAPASASVGISTDLQWAHCPISWMPFEQPVVAADGHTYDYESITQFFRNTPPPVMGPMRIKIGNKFLLHNWHLIASLGNIRHFDIAPEFNNPDNDTDSDDNNSEDPV